MNVWIAVLTDLSDELRQSGTAWSVRPEKGMRMVPGLMSWHVVMRPHLTSQGYRVPKQFLTLEPALRNDRMPDEVSLLLPTNDGAARVIEMATAMPMASPQIGLGLFLADPFFNDAAERVRLGTAAIQWIANLPSIAQQDADFLQQLSDVGLEYRTETDRLARFQADGFNIAAVVCDPGDTQTALAANPQLLLVLPRVAAFAAGFPSVRQRGAAVREVAEIARHVGWSGLILMLGDAAEATRERQWPSAVDGLICRPLDVTCCP